MSNNETVRQHYVPRVYLKHFSEKEGNNKIHALKKDEFPKIIFPTTGQVCVKNELYTLKGQTEEERQAIENFYAEEIESKYDEIYSLLTDPSVKEISKEEKNLIVKTVITLLYRNYKWISTFNDFIKRTFESAIDLSESIGKDKFNFFGQEISIEGKSADDLAKEYYNRSKEYQVLTQLKVAFRLYNLRKDNGLFVTKLNDSNCSFLASDNPVTICSSQKGFIVPFDPENVLMMPLNHKFLLYLMPSSELTKDNYVARDSKSGILCTMEELTSNFLQYRNCERFVFGKRRSLEKLIDQKEKLDKVPNKDDKAESYKDVIERCKKYDII